MKEIVQMAFRGMTTTTTHVTLSCFTG
jgi:hypothetical protein